MPASLVLALILTQAAAQSPAAPPVRSLVVGSQRIVLGATPLVRAARSLRGSVRSARGAGAPTACFTTADKGVVLLLEGGAGGVVTSFAVHTVTDSSQISGCTRLRLRERQIQTGDGLKLGRLRADVEHLLGGAGKDSSGIAVYAFSGPWSAAPAAPAARTRGRAAASTAARTASGSLRVEYQGDTVTAFAGSLTIS